MLARLSFALLVPLLWSAALLAETASSPNARSSVAPVEQARVVEVVDGDTLVLSDGYEVRLVGIQAPKLPLGRRNFPTWPLAEEAKAALEELAGGETLQLVFGGQQKDRHGRLLAQLYREDGLWLQGEMVSRGLARVYGFADNRALLPELLERERQAREAGLGIWADPFYAVRRPDRLAGLTDSFQLVEGRVLEVAIVNRRAYLNFGPDWRSDFTAVLQPDAVRLFLTEGLDPQTYIGRWIRVRGWIEEWNGPLIDVTHPEQIEVLE